MHDRAMQALYLLALDPIAEVTGDLNSYGFRKERSTADAMAQCFNALAKRSQAQWILEGDIKSCFDRIDHEWLLAHIPMDKVILRQWLEAGFIEKQALHPTEEGTPQGGIISPVLANMALDGLERTLREQFPLRRKGVRTGLVNFVRYADDFVITGRSKDLLENEVRPLVERFMRERGLELSQEKTVVTHIEDGFDFLGQNVRKYKDGKRRKLLIKPSKKNVTAFLDGIRTLVKGHKQKAAGPLIEQLNVRLHGWALYHRHVVSADIFSSVDHAIHHLLWSWVKRRHRNKSSRWVQSKYFISDMDQKWVFFGVVKDKQGQTKRVKLIKAASVPIQRHTKVDGKANPYDPAWETYFEERLGVKMEKSLRGRRQLRHLWKEQGGLCPLCAQKITRLTGWHNHHIVWRSKGGSNAADNRILLHPTCHTRLHSQGLSVAKPRPAQGRP